MKVRILYFASLRERAGLAESEEEVPAGATAGSIWETIRSRDAFRDVAVRPGFAVNGEWSHARAILQEGDQLGLLPPVSGG